MYRHTYHNRTDCTHKYDEFHFKNTSNLISLLCEASKARNKRVYRYCRPFSRQKSVTGEHFLSCIRCIALWIPQIPPTYYGDFPYPTYPSCPSIFRMFRLLYSVFNIVTRKILKSFFLFSFFFFVSA